MADGKDETEPEKSDPKQPAGPTDGDEDDVLLFALASALVPIFFRRRR
jgi:hypothetical protein